GTANPFPGNIIPASQISPQALALLKYYPTTTVPGAPLSSTNFIRNALSPTDSTQFNQRIDWIENSKSSWFGRYSWGSDLQDNAGNFVGGDTITSTNVRQAVLANTRILSSSLVNEARFAWNQFNNDLAGFYANTLNVQSTLGIEGLVASSPLAYGIPAVGLGEGVTGFGGVTPWITRNNTFQGVESLSILKGSHSIKVGGEIRRLRFNQWGNQKDVGEFIFDAQSTCNPANCGPTGFIFADFMVGLPSQAYRVLSEGNAMMRSSFYAGYVQDDWKISRRLTLNLGVRYENTRPWQDKYDAMVNVQVTNMGAGPAGAYLIPNSPAPIYTRPGSGDFYTGFKFRYAQGQQYQVGDQYMGKGLVNPSNRNWGPRIGLAYNPADHWSIRAGFGMFYVQDIGNIVFDMARNMGGKDGYVISANQRTTYLSSPWATEVGSPNCPGWSGVCVNAPQIQATFQNNRTPYVQQYLLNVQRELTRNLVLEVGYLGNQGHHLDRFTVVNQAILPSGPNDHSSAASRRPWPLYGNIQEVAGVVNSNYNALNGKLTQRLAKGLTYTAAFTWSKAIDGGSATRTNGGDTLWANNSYTLNTMRGPSQFNMPRRFVASYVYALPFGHGGSFLTQGVGAAIAGGWQLGGILTLADGTPLQGSTLGDTTNVGNLANFPNVTGASPIPTNRSATNYWNAAAFDFTNPNLAYQMGNEGRNVLSSPGSQTFNASLARDIKIKERHNVNFRFEAFNALNHPNWNTPPNDPRSPATFGIVTSAKTMRSLQLALKYSF
ncbi:MAG TPA: TonB-dependent receptor, partial [Bryobacteraceae bacterium]